MIIDDFYNWFLTLKTPDDCDLDIEQINFDKHISDNTLKKTIVVDFINSRYIGKFVIWEDDSCFSELIEIDSEDIILHERFEFNSLSELKLMYEKMEAYFI